jgi:hypothetical protein
MWNSWIIRGLQRGTVVFSYLFWYCGTVGDSVGILALPLKRSVQAEDEVGKAVNTDVVRSEG